MKRVIKNVNVIPMTDELVLEGKDVFIEDRKIVSIEETGVKDTDGFEIVDGSGKYLMPGLIDAHMHLGESLGHELKLFAAFGVTGVRNMWGSMSLFNHNPSFDAVDIKNKVANKEMIGPRIMNTSKLYNDEPAHQQGSNIVSSVEEVEGAIQASIDAGYDYIKIYDNLKLEVFNEIMKVSKEKDIKVLGHRPTAVDQETFMTSGIHSIEHTMYSDVEHAQGLIDNGIYYVPTLVTIRNFEVLMDNKVDTIKKDEEMKFVSKVNNDGFWEPFAPIFPTFKEDENSSFYGFNYADEEKKVAKFIELGGEVVAGTDYANPYVYAGLSMHEELQLIKNCGASNFQALKSGTINAAKCLMIDDLVGTVEVGKEADLVLLNSNPLEQLENTMDIDLVILAGTLYDSESIDEMKNEVISYYQVQDASAVLEASKSRIEDKYEASDVEALKIYEGTYKKMVYKMTIEATGAGLAVKMMGMTMIYEKGEDEHQFVNSDDSDATIVFALDNGVVKSLETTFKGQSMVMKKK